MTDEEDEERMLNLIMKHLNYVRQMAPAGVTAIRYEHAGESIVVDVRSGKVVPTETPALKFSVVGPADGSLSIRAPWISMDFTEETTAEQLSTAWLDAAESVEIPVADAGQSVVNSNLPEGFYDDEEELPMPEVEDKPNPFVIEDPDEEPLVPNEWEPNDPANDPGNFVIEDPDEPLPDAPRPPEPEPQIPEGEAPASKPNVQAALQQSAAERARLQDLARRYAKGELTQGEYTLYKRTMEDVFDEFERETGVNPNEWTEEMMDELDAALEDEMENLPRGGGNKYLQHYDPETVEVPVQGAVADTQAEIDAELASRPAVQEGQAARAGAAQTAESEAAQAAHEAGLDDLLFNADADVAANMHALTESELSVGENEPLMRATRMTSNARTTSGLFASVEEGSAMEVSGVSKNVASAWGFAGGLESFVAMDVYAGVSMTGAAVGGGATAAAANTGVLGYLAVNGLIAAESIPAISAGLMVGGAVAAVIGAPFLVMSIAEAQKDTVKTLQAQFRLQRSLMSMELTEDLISADPANQFLFNTDAANSNGSLLKNLMEEELEKLTAYNFPGNWTDDAKTYHYDEEWYVHFHGTWGVNDGKPWQEWMGGGLKEKLRKAVMARLNNPTFGDGLSTRFADYYEAKKTQEEVKRDPLYLAKKWCDEESFDPNTFLGSEEETKRREAQRQSAWMYGMRAMGYSESYILDQFSKMVIRDNNYKQLSKEAGVPWTGSWAQRHEIEASKLATDKTSHTAFEIYLENKQMDQMKAWGIKQNIGSYVADYTKGMDHKSRAAAFASMQAFDYSKYPAKNVPGLGRVVDVGFAHWLQTQRESSPAAFNAFADADMIKFLDAAYPAAQAVPTEQQTPADAAPPAISLDLGEAVDDTPVKSAGALSSWEKWKTGGGVMVEGNGDGSYWADQAHKIGGQRAYEAIMAYENNDDRKHFYEEYARNGTLMVAPSVEREFAAADLVSIGGSQATNAAEKPWNTATDPVAAATAIVTGPANLVSTVAQGAGDAVTVGTGSSGGVAAHIHKVGDLADGVSGAVSSAVTAATGAKDSQVDGTAGSLIGLGAAAAALGDGTVLGTTVNLMNPAAIAASLVGEVLGDLYHAEQEYFSKSKAPVRSESVHGMLHQLHENPHDHNLRRQVNQELVKFLKVVAIVSIPPELPDLPPGQVRVVRLPAWM